MDLEEFNEVFNHNDDFIPNFDLGMDEIMSGFMLDGDETETEGAEEESQVVPVPSSNNDSDTVSHPRLNFAISDEDIHDFVVNQKAKATVYKDTSGAKRLQTFLKERNPTEERMFYELPKADLDHLMCEFYILARKAEKPGQTDFEYEPDTLSSYRNSWQRVISDQGLKYDIKKDPEFEKSCKVLKSRRKELTNKGKGNKPNAARNLEQDEVNILYETGFFGTQDPVALQRTIWWKLSLQFGYRGVQESTKLQFGDVKLATDENGKEYLLWDTDKL